MKLAQPRQVVLEVVARRHPRATASLLRVLGHDLEPEGI